MAKKNFSIDAVKVNWTEELLSDIFSTATYGSDWLEIHVSEGSCSLWNELKEAEPDRHWTREEKWATVILHDGFLAVVDHFADEDDKNYDESVGGALYIIGLREINEGVNAYARENFVSLARLLENEGEADYYDGNEFMQCVLFGETIYG